VSTAQIKAEPKADSERGGPGAFETCDFYLACFLRCAGYELIDLRGERRRRAFSFKDRPTRREDVLAWKIHEELAGADEAVDIG
jgi:hypothetical protein